MPIYLKYGDIKGDVTEPAHSGWIELMSVQWGVSRGVGSPVSPGGWKEGSGPSVSEISVTKKTDRASNRLMNESLSGKGVTAVVDHVKDSGGVATVYLRLTMSETLISSWQISGSGGKGDQSPPTESLTLSFTKIEFEQFPGTPP